MSARSSSNTTWSDDRKLDTLDVMTTFNRLVLSSLALTIGMMMGLQAVQAAPAQHCPEKNIGHGNDTTIALKGDTTKADDDGQASECGAPGGRDISYSWTAPVAGTYAFDTGGTNFDTIISIEDGACGDVIACNDDGGPNLTSYLEVGLDADQEITITIDGFSEGAFGPFFLHINLQEEGGGGD